VLTPEYLRKVAALADLFRPYGLRVWLTARFSAPIEIGGLRTADPLDPGGRRLVAGQGERDLPDDPRLRRLRREGQLRGAAGARTTTAARTPTAPTCSPTRWPRTAAS
jgi:hypothetical protein